MYRFFCKREQKAYIITMVIQALAAAGILYGVFRPSKLETYGFLFFWFCIFLVFQLNVLFLPECIQRYFLKKISPLEKQLILKKKIKCIQEEIKRINGQPYDKDIFHNF